MKKAMLAVLLFGCPMRDNSKKPGHIYDTTFGAVYCAASYCRNGTCELSMCADGNTYFVHNVRRREAE